MSFWRKFIKLDTGYMNALSHAGTIGLHMVSGVAVGTIIGWLLDKWLGTSPWLTGIFLIVGIVAGFKNVYVDTKKLVASQKEEDEKRFSSQKPDNESSSR